MKRSIAIVLVVFVGILFISGCPTPPEPPSAKTGTISIFIPDVASWILGDRESESSSKAFLHADSAEITLNDSDDSLVDYWTVSGGTTSSRTVLVGTGYKLHVDVFNTEVSDSEPVVAGDVEDIAVTAGQTTDVVVTCFPVAPTPLTEGVPSGGLTLAEDGEQWFTCIPSQSEIYEFSVSSIDPSDTEIYIFGPDGLLIDDTDPSSADVVTISVTAGSTYYMGILESGTGGSFTVLYEPSGALNITIQ